MRFRNMQFAARLIVEGFYQGKHRSPFYDFSSEFADYRPYTPGDEIRAVDWKAYARTDRYYIKLFRKETDMSCAIVVDKSSSMGFRGDAPISKLEYASFLAAALSFLVITQGDKAGLAICDTKMRTYIPSGGTTQTLQRMMVELERVVPSGLTQLSDCLQVVFGLMKRRGLLVVISDFLDDTDKLFSALSMFAHRGFSVLLFHVMSDDELNLPEAASALFVDPESMRSVAVEPESVRRAYQEEIRGFIGEMTAQAKARRMHYQLASTADPYDKALEAFLTARKGMG